MSADRLRAALRGSYRIERELGAGGMATVYLAHDVKHDRKVALKVLKPELGAVLGAERFLSEIKVTANLQHPNLLPLFDSGAADGLLYYVMPYIEGETLRARLDRERQLPVDETVRLITLLAGALDYAHARGVVHRDLKPENILLSGGAAVVTDFGIAKALAASKTEAPGGTLTEIGTSLGTPAYMAPEQAVGDPVDHRADLYAWGVVAYELLANGHPFAGRSTSQQMIAAHIAETPPSLASRRPGVPGALAALVMRCLEKNPAHRPASASEVLAALESANTPSESRAQPAFRPRGRGALIVMGALLLVAVTAFVIRQRARGTAPIATRDKSLTVLPFTSTGGDTANSYLAEGIADEVTNTLAQVPGLRLAGRTSSARVARTGGTPQEVGAALQVGAVLDGTVRRAGDQIRVTAELSNAHDGMVIWHESYERSAKYIFAVQDEIARAIAGQLQITLAGPGVATVRGTSDATAYDLYLRGMYLYRRRNSKMTGAISNFEQAIARDSLFARAWAGLGSALVVSPYYVDTRMGEVLPRARRAAERAIQLDSMLSEGDLALGFVLGESFDYGPAEAEPRYRLGWLLVNTGRFADAIPVLQQGMARDPLYFLIPCYLGWAEIETGQVAQGLADERRAAELEPDNVAALSVLTRDYTRAGLPDSARKVARRLVALTRSPMRVGAAAFALARSGERAEAETLIRQMEALPPDTWTRSSALAVAYAGIGDTARAIDMMERAASGDGDLFVSFATFIAGELPPDPRIDAVWRPFHLDPALFATRPESQRPSHM